MNKIANRMTTFLIVVMLLAGLGVLLYPTVSSWFSKQAQNRVLVGYNEAVVEMNTDESTAMIAEAETYNEQLAALPTPIKDYTQLSSYSRILNLSETGIMGYVSIPAIQVELPIYHGTDDAVLDVGAGHLEGTSLPVGGENTHAVISAHRGLPSAKLFTNLDKLVVGDVFTITILDQVLSYQIEEINTVLPHEIENLTIEDGKDYVTLMTCTPYGVNTHRLLLRSRRIETESAMTVRVTADAMELDPLVVFSVMGISFLMILLSIAIFGVRNRSSAVKAEYLRSVFGDRP